MKRLLDPLGLVLKAGVWYLVALSGRTRSLRTFRVSRVLAVKAARRGCVRPDDFDLAAHWAEASGGFLGSWETVPVQRAACTAIAMWMVRYVQDPTRRRVGARRRGPSPTPTAGSRSPSQFENHDMAGYELMRLGGDVEVLEPVELRQTTGRARRVDGGALRRRASLSACPSPTRSSASTAGARATASPFEPPELGWEAGDVVTYRCVDCADMWYLEVTEDDLEDDEAPPWF